MRRCADLTSLADSLIHVASCPQGRLRDNEILHNNVIHAWCRETSAGEYERYRTTLSVDELVQCDRFHFAHDRHDYANAHDLLRTALSRYVATPADAWRFQAPPHGKPVLAPESSSPTPLAFSLSHTRQIVACVVSSDVPVGIDIERADHVRDVMTTATRFFSPAEVASLGTCVRVQDLQRRFIELWTLKEAFIKATGKGMSQPLNTFAFDLDEENLIHFMPPPDEASASWRFSQYEIAPNVIAAIAVRGADAPAPVMRLLRGETATFVRPCRTTGTGESS